MITLLPKQNEIQRSADGQRVLRQMKNNLSNRVALALPRHEGYFVLETDAGDIKVG